GADHVVGRGDNIGQRPDPPQVVAEPAEPTNVGHRLNLAHADATGTVYKPSRKGADDGAGQEASSGGSGTAGCREFRPAHAGGDTGDKGRPSLVRVNSFSRSPLGSSDRIPFRHRLP